MTQRTPTNGKPSAVVTGSSSSIGVALATELARRGYDLLLTSQTGDLDVAVGEVRSGGGHVGVDRVAADLAAPGTAK